MPCRTRVALTLLISRSCANSGTPPAGSGAQAGVTAAGAPTSKPCPEPAEAPWGDVSTVVSAVSTPARASSWEVAGVDECDAGGEGGEEEAAASAMSVLLMNVSDRV